VWGSPEMAAAEALFETFLFVCWILPIIYHQRFEKKFFNKKERKNKIKTRLRNWGKD